MGLPRRTIEEEIEKTLALLGKKIEHKALSSIRDILYANLDRNRGIGYIGIHPENVEKYVFRVVDHYQRLSPFLFELQIAKNTDVWKPLYERMRKWAYSFLLKKGFYSGKETQDTAEACATEAAILILNAHFPYDTEFDAWAHTVTQNACRKFIRKATRKKIVPQKQLVSIDDVEYLLPHTSSKNRELQNELADELEEALSQLSEARRTVIEFHYLEGRSFSEIARKTGKTVSAIHSLHFNALRDLRKILFQKGNSLDE